MHTLLNVTKKLCLDNPVRIIAVKELRCLSGLLPAANRAVAHHPGTHAVSSSGTQWATTIRTLVSSPF